MADVWSCYLGLDLGQSADYTALCVLEEPVWIPDEETRFAFGAAAVGWNLPTSMNPGLVRLARESEQRRGQPERPTLAARHLERFPLGTSYPTIVGRVVAMLTRGPLSLHPTALVVDATGVGAPVVDLFIQAGLQPVAITITGGASVQAEGANISVPKRDLVSTMAVLLENERLQFVPALPEAPTLKRELARFKRTVNRQGVDTYAAWREADHDDLVLAVALAAWFREWYTAHLYHGETATFDYRNGRWLETETVAAGQSHSPAQRRRS